MKTSSQIDQFQCSLLLESFSLMKKHLLTIIQSPQMQSLMLGPVAMILMASAASAAQTCSPGTFMEADSCVFCETGKYSNQVDASSCRHCPSGTAATNEGASSCIDCQPGLFAPWGSSSCEYCGVGTYSDQARSATCKTCPSGQYASGRLRYYDIIVSL